MEHISLEQEINWRERKLETLRSTKRLMVDYGSSTLSFDEINHNIQEEENAIKDLKKKFE